MNNIELYGKDTIEGIVAVESEKDKITVLFKNKKKQIITPFKHMIWLANESQAKRIEGITYSKLKGEGHNILVETNSKNYWTFRKYFRQSNIPYFTVNDIAEQYMIKTGRTLFKGMEFKDLKRFQFNIEATGLSTTDSRILIICYKCGKDSDYIIGSEEFIIRHFIEVVKMLDPDVIESYNGFSYDLQLLLNRARALDIPLELGRNGSELYFFKTFIRMGDNQSVETYIPKIWGRHCVDLYYSVRAWDSIYRELESYKLDEVSERFGLHLDDMDIDKTKIEELLKTNKEQIINHCMNDCIATDFLSRQLTQKDFYQTQMIPLNYEKICIGSSSAKMTGMFTREYYRNGMAIPLSQEKEDFQGALVNAERRGIFENVYHIDVSSLYPSVMLLHKICPATDSLKVFPKILKHLTTLRLDLKAKSKTSDNERYKAEEQAFKILINSMYGLLGSGHAFQWNDMKKASKVTEEGRKILEHISDVIRENDFEVYERDTDGQYFGNGKIIEDPQSFLDHVNESLPEGIECDINYYKFFCNILPKNYIKVTANNEMKMSGVSFRSRGIEKFGKDFIRESIWDILNKRFWRIRKRYLKLRKRIMDKTLTLEELLQHRTISKSVETYQLDKKKSDKVYEALIRRNKNVPVGDKISFYVAKEEDIQIYRLKDEYNKDYDVPYMLERLEAFCVRLKPLLIEEIYNKTFSKPKYELTNQDYIYKEMCHTWTDENGVKQWSKWSRIKLKDVIKYIKEHSDTEVYASVQKFRYPQRVYHEDFVMDMFFDLDFNE